MTNALLILGLIVGPLAAYIVVLTLPRWFARSLHRHRMWRLRDTVVDDVLDGRLPRENPAVRQLIATMDGVLRDQHANLLDVYIVRRACRDADPAFLKAGEKLGLRCPLDGLSTEQRKVVERYRESFQILLVGSMLLGSWFGIAHILPFVPAGIAEGMRQAGIATRDGIRHRIEGLKDVLGQDIRVSAREATDIAASRSRIGQQAAAFAVRYEAAQIARNHSVTAPTTGQFSSLRR